MIIAQVILMTASVFFLLSALMSIKRVRAERKQRRELEGLAAQRCEVASQLLAFAEEGLELSTKVENEKRAREILCKCAFLTDLAEKVMRGEVPLTPEVNGHVKGKVPA